MKAKNLLVSFAIGLGFALAAMLLLSPAPAARAAGPWYVSSKGNDSDCLSWANACTTIAGALSKASSGDTINVATGVYTENVFISQDIVLVGAGAGSTFIDGGGSDTTIEVYQYRDVTIAGMTVCNGGNVSSGGGIYAGRESVVQLTDVTVFDNQATNYGGGIYMDLLSTVMLSNTTVISNSAGQSGGGIYSTAPGGSLFLVKSTVTENSAGAAGGGIYQNAGTLTIEGSNVISNTAQTDGGGIAKSNGVMTITTSVVAENAASNLGGGIYGTGCTVTIDDSAVRDNQLSAVSGKGGGIFNDAEMTLTNVTISGNVSLDTGGGIHNQDPLTLTNVTVSGNGSGNGGGIFNTGAYTTSLLNCTIVSNTTSVGGNPGGMRIFGTMIVRNTIVAYNGNANCVIGGSLTSLGYNLEDADTCGLDAAGDKVDTDPLIGPLQKNGGTAIGIGESTLTHALLGNSPAINGGDPAYTALPDYDQRGVGYPRVLFSRVDIGAYEATILLDQFVYLPLVLQDN